MNPAATLEQAEHRNPASGTSSSLALANPAKAAFVYLNLAGQKGGRFRLQMLGNKLSQLVKIQAGQLRLTPVSSAAERAVAPATKCLINSS